MSIPYLILQSLGISFYLVGLYEATSEGEPLYFVRRFLDRWGLNKYLQPKTWYMPILGCNACMASFHSLYIWFVFPISWPYLAPQIIITYGIIRFIRNQWYQS